MEVDSGTEVKVVDTAFQNEIDDAPVTVVIE